MSDHVKSVDKLCRRIQKVLGGQSETVVLQAVLKTLLTVVGVGAPDLARGEALLDSIPVQLKPALAAEWPKYREHRARASAASIIPASH